MVRIVVQIMVLGLGAAVAGGIAALVGHFFPKATLFVFWGLFAWWAWIGFIYSGRRARAERALRDFDNSN